jgi:hypothetical protein
MRRSDFGWFLAAAIGQATLLRSRAEAGPLPVDVEVNIDKILHEIGLGIGYLVAQYKEWQLWKRQDSVPQVEKDLGLLIAHSRAWSVAARAIEARDGPPTEQQLIDLRRHTAAMLSRSRAIARALERVDPRLASHDPTLFAILVGHTDAAEADAELAATLARTIRTAYDRRTLADLIRRVERETRQLESDYEKLAPLARSAR